MRTLGKPVKVSARHIVRHVRSSTLLHTLLLLLPPRAEHSRDNAYTREGDNNADTMSSAAHSMYANYNKGKVITTRLGNWTVCRQAATVVRVDWKMLGD